MRVSGDYHDRNITSRKEIKNWLHGVEDELSKILKAAKGTTKLNSDQNTSTD